ncbi:hypothetical protein GW17_00049629 [Ensete ventricosum]|nr:hypothetical protein GW17_00049629 [Ensete ventricosum]RZS08577.1 hypothetical protein BHM03_00039560 [Ensete ventricosum]
MNPDDLSTCLQDSKIAVLTWNEKLPNPPLSMSCTFVVLHSALSKLQKLQNASSGATANAPNCSTTSDGRAGAMGKLGLVRLRHVEWCRSDGERVVQERCSSGAGAMTVERCKCGDRAVQERRSSGAGAAATSVTGAGGGCAVQER